MPFAHSRQRAHAVPQASSRPSPNNLTVPNRIEVVDYADIQFTKAPHVLRGMGLDLDKNEKARRELAQKGMAEPAA